jgi:hypothetical protein
MADGPADGLTPRQEEVRRLLADARHTGPMPDDVAGRLDEVLAGLSTGSGDDRAATPADPATPVRSLAAARRRRATTMVVAAAAVVAVGVGLGQVVGNGLGGGESADSTAAKSSRDGGVSADRDVPSEPAGGESRTQRDLVVPEPLPVSPQHFSSDVRRIRAKLGSRIVDQTSANPSPLSSSPTAAGACSPERRGPGAFVPVRYGRQHGVLVFRVPQGDAQVVELFACGNPEALRSVTLSAP